MIRAVNAGTLWLLALSFLCGVAQTEDYWRALPYDKLHDALGPVKPLDDARHIHLDRRISTTAPDMTLADVRMVIGAESGDIEVAIGEDGSLDFPMSEALLGENPPVRVNVPEGQLAINVEIAWKIPAAQSFGYDLVTDLEEEYRRFVEEQGMLARMMAPDMEGLALQFGDGERATAKVSAPTEVLVEAGEDGRIVIPVRKQWAGSEVTLSRMPEGVVPVFED